MLYREGQLDYFKRILEKNFRTIHPLWEELSII